MSLFDDPRPQRRGGKAPVAVTLFVHKDLKASLLCSQHGEPRFDRNGKLVGGFFVPWSRIVWPDDERYPEIPPAGSNGGAGMREAFRRWQMREPQNRAPLLLTFAIPEWLAIERGLV